MNPFEQMCNTEIRLIKANGETQGPFKCAFAREKIELFDIDFGGEEGDSIVRSLPNGREESYTIEEVHFEESFHAIPACYSIYVRKDSSLKQRPRTGNTTNVNITGSHGIQVGDHNTQSITRNLTSIVNEIDSSDASQEEKEEAKSRLAKFLEHPLTCSILGGAVAGAVGLVNHR